MVGVDVCFSCFFFCNDPMDSFCLKPSSVVSTFVIWTLFGSHRGAHSCLLVWCFLVASFVLLFFFVFVSCCLWSTVVDCCKFCFFLYLLTFGW